MLTVAVCQKDRTKAVNLNLNLSDMPDRVYVDNKLWLSTAYGFIRVGIDGGKVYQLVDGELKEVTDGH